MITIGIITNTLINNFLLYDMIDSIIEQSSSVTYEIVVIGGNSCIHNLPIRHIPFDEAQKPKGWITRKKNILTAEATYETIVYAHDYFRFDDGWLNSWEKFIQTTPFDVAVNRIHNLEGTRHSDWVVDPYLLWDMYPELFWKYWEVSLPYEQNYTKIQYISGNYFVAKKAFMNQYPLNEELLWGDSEDIEWSKRVRQHTTFAINLDATATIQKPGKWHPSLITTEHLNALLARHYDISDLL